MHHSFGSVFMITLIAIVDLQSGAWFSLTDTSRVISLGSKLTLPHGRAFRKWGKSFQCQPLKTGLECMRLLIYLF